MTVLNTNKPVWFDKEGGLLDNGYIYVGQVDTAPQNFPINVTLTDSSGTETIVQPGEDSPLRTNSAGQIVYLGNPVVATVGENYSLLILDSQMKQVDYIAEVDAGVISGSVDAKVYATQAAAAADVTLVSGTMVTTLAKTTAFDGDGAEWQVVAYTGTPGDDVDLVDMANGNQLKRLENYLASNKNLQEIADAGGAAQTSARTNLDVYSKAEALEDAANTVSSSNIQSSAVDASKLSSGAALSNIGSGNITSTYLATGSTERDWVLARIAGLSEGVVGSYMLGDSTSNPDWGDNVAGSTLNPINIQGTPNVRTISGTWKCLGIQSGGSPDGTLFVRIS